MPGPPVKRAARVRQIRENETRPPGQLIKPMTREEIVRLARDVAETASARLGRNGSAPGLAEADIVEPGCGACTTAPGEGIEPGPAGAACPDWVAPTEGIAGLIDHTLLLPMLMWPGCAERHGNTGFGRYAFIRAV